MFELSIDQEIAYTKIKTWLKDNKRTKLLTLGGLAGVGKTWLVANIAKEFENKLRIACCALSGKAASNLRQKLLSFGYEPEYCGTIHRLIYKPLMSKSGTIIGWKRNPDVFYDVIILDEASMVSEKIYADLAYYGIPILAVGDHGQLPPIEGKLNLMEDPMIKLEKIHRQAEGNPIIQLAAHVRETGELDRSFESDKIKFINEYESIDYVEELYKKRTTKDILDYGCLCYTNFVRGNFNYVIRQSFLGSKDIYPNKGDILVCLRNNDDLEIYNGYRGRITSKISKVGKDHLSFRIDFEDEGIDDVYIDYACKHQFNYDKTFISFEGFHKFKFYPKSWAQVGMLFDYGYATTVHKCLHPDTLVETEFGLQKIKDINDSGIISTHDGGKEYHSKFVREKSKLIKLTTEEGYSITTTEDHGIAVYNNNSCTRKEMKDVVIGDTVAISFEKPIVNKESSKDIFKQVRDCGKFKKEYMWVGSYGNDVRKEFLRTLFHYIIVSGKTTEIKLSYPEYFNTEYIATMLLGFGIKCKFNNKELTINKSYINRFIKDIGFDMVPIESIPTSAYKDDVQEKLVYLKVSSIKEDVNEESYCVTVPDGNRFNQNGFPNFNCQGSQIKHPFLYSKVPAVVSTEEKKRWLYTAVTRAVEDIRIIV